MLFDNILLFFIGSICALLLFFPDHCRATFGSSEQHFVSSYGALFDAPVESQQKQNEEENNFSQENSLWQPPPPPPPQQLLISEEQRQRLSDTLHKYFDFDENPARLLKRLAAAGLIPVRPFLNTMLLRDLRDRAASEGGDTLSSMASNDERDTMAPSARSFFGTDPLPRRPPPPKDPLVEYLERALDALLDGRLQPGAPKSPLLDRDYIRRREQEMAAMMAAQRNEQMDPHQSVEEDSPVDGSGDGPGDDNQNNFLDQTQRVLMGAAARDPLEPERNSTSAPSGQTTTTTVIPSTASASIHGGAPPSQSQSSIAGIPVVAPALPRVPVEVVEELSAALSDQDNTHQRGLLSSLPELFGGQKKKQKNKAHGAQTLRLGQPIPLLFEHQLDADPGSVQVSDISQRHPSARRLPEDEEDSGNTTITTTAASLMGFLSRDYGKNPLLSSSVEENEGGNEPRRVYFPDGVVLQRQQDDFQYGQKPWYRQGVLSTLWEFLGLKPTNNRNPSSSDQWPPSKESDTDAYDDKPQNHKNLDQVLTDWILEHSPRHLFRDDHRRGNNQNHQNEENDDLVQSSFATIQRWIQQSVATPLCTPPPQPVTVFDVDAFQGQWFQVLFSPMLLPPSSSQQQPHQSGCQILSYELLERGQLAQGVGSVFQTLEYSSGNTLNGDDDFQDDENEIVVGKKNILLNRHRRPSMASGHAFVQRAGQLVLRRANSPQQQDQIVHVVHLGERVPAGTGPYQYAVLSINCNFPLAVIARDPYTFRQKYEAEVYAVLEQKGLVSAVSRLLNIVAPVDPDFCRYPRSLFQFGPKTMLNL